MSTKPFNDPCIEEAIEWVVRMQSGDISEMEKAALHEWRQASPGNESAFQKLTNGLSPLRASPLRGQSGARVLQALQAPSSRRQFLRRSLAVGGLAFGAGLALRIKDAGLALPGDLYTGTGERRSWELEDGSHLNLNARSSVRPLFNSAQRSLLLGQGEIVVDVARNYRGPLLLETAAGVVHAERGKVLLREESSAIRVVTLDSNVALTAGSLREHVIPPHQSVLFSQVGILSQAAMYSFESSWLDGWLTVRNQQLGWVVEAMRPYRQGILRVDSAVAGLRVSGLFPLDDSEQALEMLERSLPIKVSRHSRYWVSIGSPS